MTEDEARRWIADRCDAAAQERLERLAVLVAEENDRQNLVAPSTVATLWSRHMADSLQLLGLAPAAGTWLDVGTGGGFPGLAVACVRFEPTLLVEPRRRRAEFLAHAADLLGLAHVRVEPVKVEQVEARAAIVSARAVAPVERLVAAARHVATRDTIWLLPRGRFDPAEARDALRRLRGTPMFHVEQSLTSPDSSVLVLTGVGAS